MVQDANSLITKGADSGAPRFVADGMVGRLAKWLLFAGVDVIFFRDAPDSALAALARSEGRVLLTRDRELADSLPPSLTLFVRYQRIRDQLKQVMEAFPGLIDSGRFFSRCTACNEPLALEEKSAVGGEVPPSVFAAHDRFWRCPACGSVYWRGSHTEAARRILADIEQNPQTGKARF